MLGNLPYNHKTLGGYIMSLLSIKKDGLYIDNEPFMLISGDIHSASELLSGGNNKVYMMGGFLTPDGTSSGTFAKEFFNYGFLTCLRSSNAWKSYLIGRVTAYTSVGSCLRSWKPGQRVFPKTGGIAPWQCEPPPVL